MPFDGSGNYSRVHDWTTDRDNGIKIRADRMDAEMDDQAAAFNVVFFRNGLVPMSGDLSMGANDIKGIASGSAAAPSVQFSVDPNTGLFLDGAGALGFSANGVQRFEVNTTGAEVTGTLSVSGASTLTGNTTVGGTLGVTGIGTFANELRIGNAAPVIALYNAAVSTQYGSITHNATTLTINNFVAAGAINFNTTGAGAVQANGSTIWTAGNDGAGSGLDADLLDGVQGAAYALLAGATFTGAINGTSLALSGNATVGGTLGVTGALTGAAGSFTSLTVGGSAVWTAGNDGAGSGLDADLLDGAQGAAYALLAGATFTGNVNLFGASGSYFAVGVSADSNRGGQIKATGAAASGTFYVGSTSGGYNVELGVDGATTLAITAAGIAITGTATVGGSTIWTAGNDGAGSGLDADLLDGVQGIDYRRLPRSTTATTISTADIGKCIAITANIDVPNSTFAAGDAVTIYNDSAGALTVTQGAGVTLRLAGTATTGNRTIAARGLATIWFNTASEAIISGPGLT